MENTELTDEAIKKSEGINDTQTVSATEIVENISGNNNSLSTEEITAKIQNIIPEMTITPELFKVDLSGHIKELNDIYRSYLEMRI